MAKMYYLCSKEKRLEAIYICDDGEYIENARLQTGVYPFGSILSKALKILSPCLGRKYNPFVHQDKISDGFHTFSEPSPSFSSVVTKDGIVRISLELLLIDHRHLHPSDKFERLFELLRSFTDYIRLCQEDSSFCSIDKLNLLTNQIGITLPQSYIYLTEKFQTREALSKTSISELLERTASSEAFEPAPKVQRKPLGKLRLSTVETPVTPYGPLTLPMQVFDIHDIIDLMLASLQCIFAEKYIIKECLFCGDLFVTRKKSIKYCPVPFHGVDAKPENCFHLKRLQDSKQRESLESTRMHKSLRVMYANKYGTDSEEYRTFIDKSQEWRDKIRDKEETEEHYVAWLKTHYKRKYRNEKTAAET